MLNDTANSGIDTGATGEGATGRIGDSEGATANTNASTKRNESIDKYHWYNIVLNLIL